MGNIDYVESYFNNELTAAGREQFEQKIIADPAFAEEVAYYCSVLQTAKIEAAAEKKKRFAEIYEQNPGVKKPGTVTKLWKYVTAAAVVAGIIFGSYLMLKPDSPRQLANLYLQENFQSLSITMSSKVDSLEVGLSLYNEGKWPEALHQFEKIIQSDSSSFDAKKYAGIVSLQLKEYDKALAYFSQLENYPGLYSNPAKLYKAIILMERNSARDAEQAKALLQQIVQNNLEGKETAKEWLSKKW
jgi:tetratricopeptide (TPR) repeat protein